MNLAAEIRAEMGRQGIGINQLAHLSGVSSATLSRKITNARSPLDARQLEAIGTALHLPGWVLMRRAEENDSSALADSTREKVAA
jgi:transcriptional regulator with XRE-family HTH domain